MATYVYRNGRMVDKETGEPMVDPSQPWVPATPMHIPDIQPYRSPVTGEYISGRRAKRADLERNNCIDANDMPSPTGMKFRNREFAAKRGLTHMLKENAK
jgi:hypothetical protein